MQPNQALPLAAAPEATVEDALEEAIFRAGGILPSNRGQLSKVRFVHLQGCAPARLYDRGKGPGPSAGWL